MLKKLNNLDKILLYLLVAEVPEHQSLYHWLTDMIYFFNHKSDVHVSDIDMLYEVSKHFDII